jgi:hypothetical protein
MFDFNQFLTGPGHVLLCCSAFISGMLTAIVPWKSNVYESHVDVRFYWEKFLAS